MAVIWEQHFLTLKTLLRIESWKILHYSYLSCDKHSNEEIMRKVALEKTAFYQRKNEAIAIMGIALWGYALPTLLKELSDEKKKEFCYREHIYA